MKLEFKPGSILRSRERRSPPTAHAARWNRSLAWLGLQRRLWRVTAGIFAGCAVFAIVLRFLLPDYQLVYPQVIAVETAVAFILLYFFVPEMIPRAGRALPSDSLLTRIRRSPAHAAVILRQAAFMALLTSGSVLPLILVRPLRSATFVQDSGKALPANWAVHFLSGEVALFCYLLLAVVVAYAVLCVIGSRFWYRMLLVFLTIVMLPQAESLWEPVDIYFPMLNMGWLHTLLEPYGVESSILGFHRSVDNPYPYPDLSRFSDSVVAIAQLIRRLLPAAMLAYLGSLIASLIEALRPAVGGRTSILAAIQRLRPHRARLLPHFLGSLALVGLAAIAVAFLGGYVELNPGQGTVQPIAVFTLCLAAITGYVVARLTADYVHEGNRTYAGLPVAALMRAQLDLAASYALVLALWGGVGLGVLIYLLGLGWVSFIAVMALLLTLVAASLVVALIVVALSRLQAVRRYSSLAAGFVGGLGVAFVAFLFYPPASPPALLQSQSADGPGLTAAFNQLLLLEGVNYMMVFDRWVNMAEFAGGSATTLIWLIGFILSGLLVFVALIWLVMRLARRLA